MQISILHLEDSYSVLYNSYGSDDVKQTDFPSTIIGIRELQSHLNDLCLKALDEPRLRMVPQLIDDDVLPLKRSL
jgi:hypothetical protein